MDLFVCLSLWSAATPAVLDDGGEPGSERNLDRCGLALHGFDPVAYFAEGGGTARPGDPARAAIHGGAVFRFASDRNRAAFVADPERFLPAHGGWCSDAMADDALHDIDPRAFRIAGGRLLLFADVHCTRPEGAWVRRERELLARADAHWQRRSGEEPRVGVLLPRRPEQWNLAHDGLALAGYDPVSYFPEGGGLPARGRAEVSLRHRGVLYRFVDEASRERFRADPDRFEPQHGGWCSRAMGRHGHRVAVDPTAFRLTGGRLHLFAGGWFGDARDDWDTDAARLRSAADAHWRRLLESAAVEDRGRAGSAACTRRGTTAPSRHESSGLRPA